MDHILKTKTKTVKFLDENISGLGVGMVFIAKTATVKWWKSHILYDSMYMDF